MVEKREISKRDLVNLLTQVIDKRYIEQDFDMDVMDQINAVSRIPILSVTKISLNHWRALARGHIFF